MRVSPLTLRLSTLLAAIAAPPLAAAIPLRIPADTAPTAVVGSAYSYQLPASGGSGSYTGFTCSPAPCPLPPGLALSATGLISGTPTAGGSFQPTFTVTDSLSATANQVVRVEAFRPVATNNWCPIGDAGGYFGAVAMSPAFGPVSGGNGSAVAGSKQGGVMKTVNAGANWAAIPFFDSLKVYALAADQVKTPVDFWAVTHRNPNSNAGGRIFHYDASTGNTTEETTQAAWMTGTKRHIRQAYLDGSGAMLASDNGAGVIYKSSAASAWAPANGGLPGTAITNIAFGTTANHTLGMALYTFGSTAAIYQNAGLATGGPWSLCASLPNGSTQWDALAMAPDGVMIAGNLGGDVSYANGCVTPTAAPAFMDGGVTVKPAVNGFAVSPCYTAAARAVYAYTDGGIFFTPNITTTVFTKISGGLLSEEVGDLGLSNSCSDPRMIAATKRHGVATAAGNDQFCHARTGLVQGTDLTAIAATGQFLNPSQYACGAGQRIYFYPTLIAASAASGVFRASGRVREMLAAADLASTAAPFAGPEHAVNDVATAFDGSGFYHGLFAATASGVYGWDDDDENNINFTPTEEPLLKIRGAPGTSLEAAYGIAATGNLYLSNTTPQPWSRVAQLSSLCTASALDLAGGGPTTLTAGNDEMWIAYGSCGVMEYQNGAAAPLIRHTGGLAGATVYRVASTTRVNASNYVYAHIISGAGINALVRGLKNNAPVNSAVTFVASGVGVGLPSGEVANQVVVEPNASGATGYVWVLFPTLGLYRSTDAGANFTALGAGLPAGFNPLQLVLSANFNGAIASQRDVTLLVAGKGLYVSSDGGATWCYGPTPVSQAASTVKSVAVQKPNGTLVASDSDTFMVGTDDGVFLTKDHGAHFYSRTFCDQVATTLLYHIGDNAMIVGSSDGLYRSTDGGQNWQWTDTQPYGVTGLAQNDTGGQIVATLSGGPQKVSVNGGATWTSATGPTDGANVSFSKNTSFAEAATAPYWMVGSTSGAWYSSNGSSWTAGNGLAGDYQLTNAGGSWLCSRNVGSSPSKVVVGNASAGVYRTLDGGDSWRRVSGAGSGLEATSQNAAALATSLTAFSNTDLLVGLVGSNNGGVYLSGDYGGHWMQLNQGFDPNALNISTLAVTSCVGCPVQYYSGTYGSGVYTRTIAVNNPPTITGWCTGAACGCATAASNGPQIGGQSFKVCGTNLQNAAVVSFGGADSAGCAMSGGGTVLTCSTPAHIAGAVPFNVRNPDTRPSLPASQNYTYTAAASRVTNLLVAKAGSNATLNWTCAGCAANPAQVFRSQNAAFSLNVENFYGGAASPFTDPNALAAWANKTYFWTVE